MVCDSFRPCPSVCHTVTTSPAAVNRPMDMTFGIKVVIDDHTPIFGKSRSKVKGQGKKSTKNKFLQRRLVTGARFWSLQDRSGSGEVVLAACQLILAACQMLQNDSGLHLEWSANIGRLPEWLARCQIWKKSQGEASRDSAMRGAPLHVYYIQFGQYTHPMDSGRPPWAAGE